MNAMGERPAAFLFLCALPGAASANRKHIGPTSRWITRINVRWLGMTN